MLQALFPCAATPFPGSGFAPRGGVSISAPLEPGSLARNMVRMVETDGTDNCLAEWRRLSIGLYHRVPTWPTSRRRNNRLQVDMALIARTSSHDLACFCLKLERPEARLKRKTTMRIGRSRSSSRRHHLPRQHNQDKAAKARNEMKPEARGSAAEHARRPTLQRQLHARRGSVSAPADQVLVKDRGP